MDQLNAVTNTINNFVRFFESINCLFWQIQWLEENISRSNNRTFLIVAVFFLFACLVGFFGDSLNADITNNLPVLVVFGVIALFIFRRCRRQPDDRARDPDDESTHPTRIMNPTQIVRGTQVYSSVPVQLEEGHGGSVELIHRGYPVETVEPSAVYSKDQKM